MAFAYAGGGDLDKLGLVLHVVNGGAAAVTHAGAQAAGHLVNDGHHRAFERHTTLNTLGHQFVGVRVAGAGLLEVAVCAALLHGAYAAHAAVTLVAAALEQDDFAGRFFGAGEHTAHHHRACASSNGFGNVAAVANAAVRNQRHAAASQCDGHIVNGHDLRHAHARHDAGGADAAGANTDLHRVRAGLNKGQGRSAGGDIAAYHVDVRVVLFNPAHPVYHALAVAVRCVHHDGVHPGLDQGFHARLSALTNADRSTYPKLAFGVAGCIRKTGLFGDVFDGDQALELEVVIDQQHPLNPVFVQQVFGIGQGAGLGHGDQAFTRRHDGADRLFHATFKAQITSTDNADHTSAFNDGKARNAELLAHFNDLAHGVLWRDDHRVS